MQDIDDQGHRKRSDAAKRADHEDELLDETLRESFPSSDPPSNSGSAATPADEAEHGDDDDPRAD